MDCIDPTLDISWGARPPLSGVIWRSAFDRMRVASDASPTYLWFGRRPSPLSSLQCANCIAIKGWTAFTASQMGLAEEDGFHLGDSSYRVTMILPCRFTNTKLNKYNWTKQLSKKTTEQKSIDQTNNPTKINWSKSYWTMSQLIKFLAEQIAIEQLINWHLFSCQEGT